VERFKAHYKVMEKFLKDLREYIKAFKTLGLAQTALNEGIGSFYDHTSTLNTVNEKNKQCALLLDQYRQNLDENIDRDVVAPLNAHMGTYKILKKRVAERDRRVTDYDRFKAEVKALTVNPSSKPEKVHEAQHNLAVSKHAYEVLEAELMQDMEALHNDRLSFFDPCFAVILNMQHGYYAEGYKLFSELVAMVSHVDPASIHSHVAPITPEEFTMANPKNVTPPEMEAYVPPPTQQYGAPQGGGYATSPAPPRGGSQFGQPQPYQPPQEAYGAPPQYGAPQGGGGYLATPSPQQVRPRGASSAGGAAPYQPPAGGGGTLRGALPPKPAPARQVTARALYPFTAQNPSELSFNPGDVLIILAQEGDWWNASLNGRTGLIPGNYVQLV